MSLYYAIVKKWYPIKTKKMLKKKKKIPNFIKKEKYA